MSPAEMQEVGHSPSHAPHAIHASVILYAIFLTSVRDNNKNIQDMQVSVDFLFLSGKIAIEK